MAHITVLRHINDAMPKVIPNSEFDAVLQVFRSEVEPLSLERIQERITDNLSRRTLQRRLSDLVTQDKLTAIGERGGRRYRLVVPLGGNRLREEPGLALSPEATDIRHSVTRSLAARRPVGYQAKFLEKYQPNVTSYLRASDLAQLASLGEVASGSLPPGTYFRKVISRLLIDLSWNSSRLEGNTYSLLETERLLELGETAEGKDARDAQMILNHKAAIELLAEQPGEIGFNRYTICNLHALLSDNLLPDPRAGGRLRDRPVGITGTVYHPTEIPQVVEDHFQQILRKAEAIENAFEQSFFAMVHLPYLQPFEDVNKRVSRLAANIPLVRRNLCPLSFVDVPQADYVSAILGVYELNRVEYLRDVFVWAYERSCARYSAIRQSLGEPDVFRLKYRTEIAGFVREIVRGKTGKAAASKAIAKKTAGLVPLEDRARFIEAVETELTSLHEGNMARYRIRPSEFQDWLANWR